MAIEDVLRVCNGLRGGVLRVFEVVLVIVAMI